MAEGTQRKLAAIVSADVVDYPAPECSTEAGCGKIALRDQSSTPELLSILGGI
jgi:hypothetical protein|tara:strand:+ start:1452 stop:1610 length:159 start_codon:yes stop_codon:yes gene_type:complete